MPGPINIDDLEARTHRGLPHPDLAPTHPQNREMMLVDGGEVVLEIAEVRALIEQARLAERAFQERTFAEQGWAKAEADADKFRHRLAVCRCGA